MVKFRFFLPLALAAVAGCSSGPNYDDVPVAKLPPGAQPPGPPPGGKTTGNPAPPVAPSVPVPPTRVQ